MTCEFVIENNLVVFKNVSAGACVELEHEIETKEKKENVMGTDFTVRWRGCDVVDILPHGEHMRLYQRNNTIPKYYPASEDVEYTRAANYGPTQQKTKV